MSTQQFLDDMKKVQVNLLDFIDNESNDEDLFQKLKKLFDDQKISEDQHKLEPVLHLLTVIANDHHRGPNFFDKIEQIIKLFKDDIKKYFTNWQIFTIFKSSKRILLILIEEGMLTLDSRVVKEIVMYNNFQKQKYNTLRQKSNHS